MVFTRHLGKKGRLFVLALLGALLAALLFFFLQTERGTPVTLVYTAVFEADPATVRALSVGDRLTDARGKGDAGEILKITTEKRLLEDVFGVYTDGDRAAVAITLLGTGVKKNGEASLSSFTPRVGEEVYLIGRARLEGICIRVRAME